MLKLEQKDFKDYVKSLELSKTKFIVDRKRNVKSLIIGGKFFALSKNKNHTAKNDDKKEMVALMGQVSKAASRYIVKNNFYVEKIKQRHASSITNRDKFRSMKIGDEFYYIDIAHCYWRIAFLHKYISQKLYEGVLSKPKLKQYRSMALACIIAPRSRSYYDKGKMILEVSEERSLWKTIYDNIRFTSYNIMGDCAMEVEKNFIAYRTDGIMVTKPAVKKVQDFIKAAGFDYTVTRCIKVDASHYSNGTKVKKM